MTMELRDAVRQTPSYRRFLASGKKHLYETEFKALRDKVVAEAWGTIPEGQRSFIGAMAWFSPKHQAIRAVLKEDGVNTHMNSEYEDWFREWCKTQGPAPATFPSKLAWYFEKRKEFDQLYREEKQR
jgi:hypothetical protein